MGEEQEVPAENPQSIEAAGGVAEEPIEHVPEEPAGGGGKRERTGGEEQEEEGSDSSKRQKVDTSFEEERIESLEQKDDGGGEEENGSGTTSVGPKVFKSSVDMFDYFYKLLHSWSPNLNINKYEHMALLDLLKKGHPEPAKKIGEGIQAFQVRFHPVYKSRCFFLERVDGTSDDFSFRKCVDNILSLPENMKIKSTFNGGKSYNIKTVRGHQKGAAGSGGRGAGGKGGGRGGTRRRFQK